MNDLRKEFGDTYTIIMEDGFFEFLEGKATPEQTERIEKIMENDLEARNTVQVFLEYDKINGKGSFSKWCEDPKEEADILNLINEFSNHPDPS